MPKKERDFYQISLKIVLINKNGEALILKADPNGSYAGYYDLPGGRIDKDEFKTAFPEIIKREVREEIGDIKFKLNLSPIGIGRHLIPAKMTSAGIDLHILYIFFEARYVSGKISTSAEHGNFEWIKLTKAKLAKLFTSGILEGMKIYLSK